MLVPIDIIGSKEVRDFSFYSEGFSSPVGEVRIERMDVYSDEVWLWNVRILEEFRRKKLGRLLISDTISYTKETYPDIRKIVLKVLNRNIPARKLYLNCGFRTVENRGGDLLRKMVLLLN